MAGRAAVLDVRDVDYPGQGRQPSFLTLGVGYDVNSRLLDRLVNQNNGSSHYVRPDEDIEQHVAQRVFIARDAAGVAGNRGAAGA